MKYTFLKIINTLLLILIVITALYITLGPILPQFSKNTESTLPTTTQSITDITTPEINTSTNPIVPQPQLALAEEVIIDPLKDANPEISIPSINLNSKVISSNNNKDLWKGIWHRETTGNPIQGGNIVITAHRFLYTGNEDTFYHLPKIKLDDIVTLTWQGKKYEYKVIETSEVGPDAVEIEAPTTRHILTLYTCTPLWTSDRRFVAKAIPLF